MTTTTPKLCLLPGISFFIIGLLLILFSNNRPRHQETHETQKKFVYYTGQRTFEYDRNSSLIFIGGVPRSGSTLLQAMLDAHLDIRCSDENYFIPKMLSTILEFLGVHEGQEFFIESGLDSEALDSAIAIYILELLVRYGEPASRICNKDYSSLYWAGYLSKIFPNSKFIFVVRDGRAAVHSTVTRTLTFKDIELNDYREALRNWNEDISYLLGQCLKVGLERCFPVRYEDLILNPREQMERVLRFLDVTWDESVLSYDSLIQESGGISIWKLKESNKQVLEPINLAALVKWAVDLTADFPPNLVENLNSEAPMLKKLGYDTGIFPPNYESLGTIVWNDLKTTRRT